MGVHRRRCHAVARKEVKRSKASKASAFPNWSLELREPGKAAICKSPLLDASRLLEASLIGARSYFPERIGYSLGVAVGVALLVAR